MFGLFLYSYDYHTWEDLIAISTNSHALISKQEKENDYPLALTKKEHDSMGNKEIDHYYIHTVEVI